MAFQSVSPEMLNAAIQGDKNALTSLLSQTQPDIRRYALLHCASAEDAEDATQQTLWQLYRRVGTIRAVAALPAWLMTVVRRACAKMMSRPHVESLLDETALAKRTDVALRLDIAAAIESLPEHYRQVVVLRDLQDLKIDEIAGKLALTREAVKGRLHRARELMREYLRK